MTVWACLKKLVSATSPRKTEQIEMNIKRSELQWDNSFSMVFLKRFYLSSVLETNTFQLLMNTEEESLYQLLHSPTVGKFYRISVEKFVKWEAAEKRTEKAKILSFNPPYVQ